MSEETYAILLNKHTGRTDLPPDGIACKVKCPDGKPPDGRPWIIVNKAPLWQRIINWFKA